jgi:hypothetical protein
MILGSVSHAAVHDAPCPVIVVPDTSDRDPSDRDPSEWDLSDRDRRTQGREVPAAQADPTIRGRVM